LKAKRIEKAGKAERLAEQEKLSSDDAYRQTQGEAIASSKLTEVSNTLKYFFVNTKK